VKALPLTTICTRTLTALLAAVSLGCRIPAGAQQPQEPTPAVSPAQPAAPAQNAPHAGESSSGKKKNTIPGFLILGTVFNEKALSFPGVEVRVRLQGEKKFKWETHTNSRGEFAVRVPEGPQYELFVHVKHFQAVSQVVTAKGGEVQKRLSIRLEPVSQDKSGAKK
jgi:hypothetical protein